MGILHLQLIRAENSVKCKPLHLWFGWTYEKLENIDKAEECYEQSKVLLEQLVNCSPLNAELKSNLDWVSGRLNEE